MRLKISLIIIIIIIILNTLTVGWDFKLKADSFNSELNDILTSRYVNNPRAGAFDWGPIEVISEPIFGQNNNIEASTDPEIAVEDDKIYVVWQDRTDYNNAGSDYDIFYRYFDGNKWSKIQIISEPVFGQNLNTGDSECPEIDVENGKIYIVWQDKNNMNNAGTDWDIFYRCNLTGNGWENIQIISEPVLGKNFNTAESGDPDIIIENGKIYVVWTDLNDTNNAGTDGDIFYRHNLTGINWGDIQVISEPIKDHNFNNEVSFGSKIEVENGKIYVVWIDLNNTNNASSVNHDYDIFFRCNINGFCWENIYVISEPINGLDLNSGFSYGPAITVENGKIFVVWEDQNNTDNSGIDSDIFYRCNISHSFWEHIQVISEPVKDQNLNFKDSFFPDIAIENGRIYIVWVDQNNICNSGLDSDIFYRCNFTGFSWEHVQVISEPVINNNFNTASSDIPDIVIKFGKCHVIWSDGNNTNDSGTDWDIFYRCIKDPSPLFLNSPNVTPKLGNTSTNYNFTITYFNYDNIAPIKIIVNISDTEYLILELDYADKNYMDGKDYFFNIKNLAIGIHKYQFYATDGKFTWSTRILYKPFVYNTLPTIITEDNQTAFEDIYYEVDYEYEDNDVENIGQVVTWDFSTDAEWLKFNHTTAVLNGTPTNNDVGEYWVNISINDTIDTDYTNFILTVLNVNDAPIIITNNIEIINEDKLYEVEYQAIDVDSPQDNLFWNMQTNASWINFEHKTAKLSGIPENNDVGEYWVNITVNDAEFEDFSNFTLKVINVNDPPRIITKDNTTALEDEFYKMIYQAEDVDNESFELTWSIATNALWLSCNTDKAIINGTPTNDDIGEYWANISVSDNEFIDFTNFTLTVLNTNDPPMIITKDKTNATVGEIYSINYEAVDIDPPPITFTWSIKTNTSDWLTIDSITGWLNGIPSVSDVGIYWVNVSVTDGENGWDFHNFTLEVLRTPFQKNHAPQLFNASISPSEGDTKTEFTFSVHYYDADGDVPVFIQVVIDGRVYILKLKSGENALDGVYEYSTILSEGTHLYYFTAFDGSESVKTNNLTTPDIKDIDKISTEEISWYWLFLVVIVIIIIIVLILMLVLKKRKAIKLPTVQAEMLRATPEPIVLPSVTPNADITPLAARAIVSEQLPSLKVQAQSSDGTPRETISIPSLASTTIETQFQLPKATLSRIQKLELLEERFLRGEVDLENYKEFKTKIEAQGDEDITRDDLEKETSISEQQQPRVVGELTIEETSQTDISELVDKPSQQLPIESEITELQQSIQPRVVQAEPTTPVKQPKLSDKEQDNEK